MAKSLGLKEAYFLEQLELTQKALRALRVSYDRSGPVIRLVEKNSLVGPSFSFGEAGSD